jgi:peptidoglycan/xylan/chitin deacetylase (PgdA/CDA1 family)
MALQLLALAVVVLVILPAYIVYKPPKAVISRLQSHNPSVLFQIQTKKEIVALTIDDAPSTYTKEILKILRENDATTTFFVIGNQAHGNEAILADIVRAGHELGNHAMHDEPSVSLSSETLSQEIHEVDVLINTAYEQAGRQRTSHYFRPGSGVFSQRILEIAEKAGYQTILGSMYPHDPFISLRQGAVIICHDRRSWTVPMLRKALPEMKRRGYEVTSVTGLLNSMDET